MIQTSANREVAVGGLSRFLPRGGDLGNIVSWGVDGVDFQDIDGTRTTALPIVGGAGRPGHGGLTLSRGSHSIVFQQTSAAGRSEVFLARVRDGVTTLPPTQVSPD